MNGEAKFWSNVTKGSSCWIYGRGGYKNYYQHRFGDGEQVAAHVYSYLLHKGPIPEGMQVNHSCDNRRCVNPDHLCLGTYEQNSQDMYVRNRARPRGKMPLSYLQILEIKRRSHDGESGAAIARSLGYTKEGVNRVLSGIGLKRFKRIGANYDPGHYGLICEEHA